MDYQRSSKIIELLIDKLDKSQIQLIATSNDRFLINAVDLKKLNLLERKGHFIFSYNYQNNKEKFDEFIYTGLSNFDFFSGKMYKEWSRIEKEKGSHIKLCIKLIFHKDSIKISKEKT